MIDEGGKVCSKRTASIIGDGGFHTGPWKKTYVHLAGILFLLGHLLRVFSMVMKILLGAHMKVVGSSAYYV